MRAAAALSLAAATAVPHLVPSVLTIPSVHERLAPQLSGIAPGPHVAEDRVERRQVAVDVVERRDPHVHRLR